MDNVLKLDTEKILKKKFSKDLRGYDPYEVDAFLDEIMTDYQNFESFLQENDKYVTDLERKSHALEKENQELFESHRALAEEKRELEIEIASLKNKYSGIKESDKPTKENLSLIKKLNSLECFLKNEGYTESDIIEASKSK